MAKTTTLLGSLLSFGSVSSDEMNQKTIVTNSNYKLETEEERAIKKLCVLMDNEKLGLDYIDIRFKSQKRYLRVKYKSGQKAAAVTEISLLAEKEKGCPIELGETSENNGN